MKCVIIGTGDMAHALAHQYAKTDTTHYLHIASPSRKFVPNTFFHETGVAFVDLISGLQTSHVIILAIPGGAMPSFLKKYAAHMRDAQVVIDINNNPTAHEADAFDEYDLCWVKGLNDCGAIDMLTRKGKSKLKTCLSGRDPIVAKEARQFVEEAFGFDVSVVPYHKRKSTEQESLGKEWKHATYIAVSLYLLFVALIVPTYHKRWPWEYGPEHMPVTTHNRVMSCVAISLFSLSVMPGTLARMFKSWHNDSMYKLHPALIWSLGIRKHVGLLGLYFLFLHALMSLGASGPGNYAWAFYDSEDSKQMNITGEATMMFAILSTSLYAIVGLSSLPGVGESMNKAQWRFIFGPVVWTALAFGHVHNLIIFFRVVKGTRHFYGIPHATVLGSLLPWFAFFLKFVQLMLDHILRAVRSMRGKRTGDVSKTTMHSGYSGKSQPSALDDTEVADTSFSSDKQNEPSGVASVGC